MKRSRAATIELIAIALVVLCDLAYLVAVTILGIDPQAASSVNTFFRVVAVWTPVLVFWVSVIFTTSRRTPVLLAAIGVTGWAGGAVIYNLLLGSGAYVPSPNVSDIAYLSFYPFMVAAFVTLGIAGSWRAIVSVSLEAIIATLGTASVLLVLVQPILAAAASDSETRPLTLAYPLLDVALLAITAGYASSPALASARRVWWFIAGVALFVATDLAYALLTAAGEYHIGSVTDVGWAIGLALLAWWALGFTKPAKLRVAGRSSSALGVIAPLIAVVAAIGVLVYSSQQWVNVAAVVLAALTLALTAVPVLTRQTLLARLISGQERVLVELRELDVAKSEMMATLNHEMRTPLTSVIGYLEVVRDGAGGNIPSEADEMLASAEHSAKRLNSIVDEMLLLTRLDAHGLDVEMHPLDVVAIVERVVTQLTPVAEGRQVTLSLRTDATALVLGDDSRLGHAITTVTENAVKFTPNGGTVAVTVTTRKHERPVVITVTDSGMGVPAEDLPHLFERFFRGSNATIGGSGLGLAIARGIVELHGGRIRAESVLGSGTTMTVTLPAAE